MAHAGFFLYSGIMTFPAAAVANEFLELARQSGRSLTPMQVQKLVYFSHGWNLALTGEPLIDERIEAWDYGPVVRSLYKDFREFGSGKITKPAKAPNWDGPEFTWNVPCIDDSPDDEANDFTKALLRKIWQVYGGHSAFQLSEMTHVEGSPWTQARENGTTVIADNLIQDYFEDLSTHPDHEPVEV